MQVDLDRPQQFPNKIRKKCTENKIEHNSLNFRARSPKFCMQVDLDRPQPFPNKKSTKKYISTKVLITQPFFELLTSDFAWKFIWTVKPNDKVQKYKKYKSTKIQKYKSTKVQKYKNAKAQSTKNAKNAKIVKNTKKYKSTKIKNT